MSSLTPSTRCSRMHALIQPLDLFQDRRYPGLLPHQGGRLAGSGAVPPRLGNARPVARQPEAAPADGRPDACRGRVMGRTEAPGAIFCRLPTITASAALMPLVTAIRSP